MRRAPGRWSSPFFLVVWGKNHLSRTRLGITVTKKVAGAVGRNAIKRRVREVYRTSGGLYPAGLDVLVIAKRRSRGISFQQAQTELHQAWEAMAQWRLKKA